MTPWNKQHIWFWFAAIMIVAGVACFLSDDNTVQVVHKNQKSDETEPHIARSREKLVELSELRRLHADQNQAEVLDATKAENWQTAESDVSIRQFHNRREPEESTSQVQRVTYPEAELSRATLFAPGKAITKPKIVQTSVIEEHSQPKKKQLVWFSGSIKKIKE
ncbi:MAG: hypothetical protein HON04_09945 [Planctomicrobium sp.]|jgi:hypothetical protein|nr:hypothetical protein [Planctomicrobium sp.]